MLARCSVYLRKHKVHALLASVGILVLGYFLYKWLSPPSAEEVMRATLIALQRGDVQTLYRLTHPEEIRSLNLTPQAIDALLRTGVWYKGYPKPRGEPVLPQPQPRDQLRWLVPLSQKPDLVIPVYQTEDGRWYLSLSQMMAVMNALTYRLDNRAPSYWTVAERYGVPGYYTQSIITGERKLVRPPSASSSSTPR